MAMCGEGAPIELVQRFEKEYSLKKNNKQFCYMPVNDWEYIDNIFQESTRCIHLVGSVVVLPEALSSGI